MSQAPLKDNTEHFLYQQRKAQDRIFSKSQLTHLSSFYKSFYKSSARKKKIQFSFTNGFSMALALPEQTDEYKREYQ